MNFPIIVIVGRQDRIVISFHFIQPNIVFMLANFFLEDKIVFFFCSRQSAASECFHPTNIKEVARSS